MTTRTLPSESPRSERTVCDCLYFVVDAEHPGGGARYPLEGIDAVTIARGPTAAAVRTGRQLRIDRPDPWMSSQHAVLEREVGHWMINDRGSKNGVLIAGVRQNRAVVLPGDLIELGRSFFTLAPAELPPHATAVELQRGVPGALATLEPGLERRFDELRRLAPSTTPVLILGPTGAGKERVARAVHAWSARIGPFVAINCGAMPAGLVETELFGHRQGAFSGATSAHVGLIAGSSGGTLFLDEIADLPLPAQAALLRALEAREVRAVGALRTESVDLRVVAATHRDLEAEVRAGRFRDDLLARLHGLVVRLPAMAERRVDLGLMLGELVPDGISLAPAVIRRFWTWPWRRNARELVRAIERTAGLAPGTPFGIEHLPPELAEDAPVARVADDGEADRRLRLVELLTRHRGNVSHVATELGKARSQVQRWLKRYELDPQSFRAM